jgi:hypothetical protein
MLGRFHNTSLKDITFKSFKEKQLSRKEREEKITKLGGLKQHFFISEGLDFYFFWNKILLENEQSLL